MYEIVKLFIAAVVFIAVGVLVLNIDQSFMIQTVGWAFLGGGALAAVAAVILVVKSG